MAYPPFATPRNQSPAADLAPSALTTLIFLDDGPLNYASVNSALIQSGGFRHEIHVFASKRQYGKLPGLFADVSPHTGKYIFFRRIEDESALEETINHLDNGYTSFLTGSDIWLNPLKSLNQIKYMEFNADCVLSFTGCFICGAGMTIAKPAPHSRLSTRLDASSLSPEIMVAPSTVMCGAEIVKRARSINLLDIIYAAAQFPGYAAFLHAPHVLHHAMNP